jgi:predicted metal-dependent phosphoesterase TrpH
LKNSIKIDLHLHTNTGFCLPWFSYIYDCVQTAEQVIAQVIKNNLKIIAITDHDSMKGYRQAKKIITDKKLDIMLIPACEISSRDGHILAYNIKKIIPPKLSAAQTVAQIHAQGGIAVAAHPFVPYAVGNKVFNLDFDFIEGWNSQVPFIFNWLAIKAAKKLNLSWLASSDAHIPSQVGSSHMILPQNYKTPEQVFTCLENGDYKVKKSSANYVRLGFEILYKNLAWGKRVKFSV